MIRSNLRKLKQIKGRLTPKGQSQEQEESLPKSRQSNYFEEEKTISTKQKKTDNYSFTENGEMMRYSSFNKERTEIIAPANEEEGDLEFEDAYDDEWGI